MADLDSLEIIIFYYFRRACSKDYVRDDATRQANEQITSKFQDAIAAQDFDAAKCIA